MVHYSQAAESLIRLCADTSPATSGCLLATLRFFMWRLTIWANIGAMDSPRHGDRGWHSNICLLPSHACQSQNDLIHSQSLHSVWVFNSRHTEFSAHRTLPFAGMSRASLNKQIFPGLSGLNSLHTPYPALHLLRLLTGSPFSHWWATALQQLSFLHRRVRLHPPCLYLW